jgi:hypothetical protein
VTSLEEWTRVWQEHKGAEAGGKYDAFYDKLTLPLVDFDSYMVIAIFQGECWNTAGLTVVSIFEDDSHIVIRFRNKSYSTASYSTEGEGGDGGEKVTPYGFFIMPRSTKPTILEEGLQGVRRKKRDPPVWKERGIGGQQKQRDK